MRRKTLVSLFSIALLGAMALTPAVEAQREEGRRGPDRDGRRGADGEGRRGQFRGSRGGGFGSFGGGVPILDLLGRPEVREEVKVDENQQEVVDILRDEIREGRPEFPPNLRELPEEERQREFEAYREKTRRWSEEQTATAKETLKVILEPAQYTRLSQISIQTQGINALLEKDVITALNLSEEQVKQLEAARDKSREAAFTGGFGRDREGGFDREAFEERRETLQKEAEESMLAVLTADQKTAFAALKGAPFELADRGFRGGGGFGGGRGPGGGERGRPGRPGRPGGGDGERPQRPE